MDGLQCRAGDSLSVITGRSATATETGPSRTEEGAPQTPTFLGELKSVAVQVHPGTSEKWSGRLDSNHRPPAPKLDDGHNILYARAARRSKSLVPFGLAAAGRREGL